MQVVAAPPRDVLLGLAPSLCAVRDGFTCAKAPSEVTTTDGGVSERQLHVQLVEDAHTTPVFVTGLMRSCGHQGEHNTPRPPAPEMGCRVPRRWCRVISFANISSYSWGGCAVPNGRARWRFLRRISSAL